MDKTFHLGKMIQRYIDLKKYKRSTVAEKAGMFSTAIYAFEKQPSMQTTTLLRFSHALKYNFFIDIANSLPLEYSHGQLIASKKEELFTHQISEMQEVIASQAEEIKKLKFENELMRELMLGRKS